MSIHRKLLISLLVAVSLLSGTILATTFLGARRAVQVLSSQIIQQTTSEMNAHLEQFLGPARRGLAVVRAWAEAGLLPLDDPEAVNRALMPLMREFPQVSSVILADLQGRESMLLRTREGWRNRHTQPERWGARARWLEWTEGGPWRTRWEVLDYDARRRPWYQGALATPGQVSWTRPYEFFTSGQPGITVSVRFAGEGGAPRVLAFDLLLRDISRFTMTLSAGANGRVFVLTDDNRVIGLPDLEEFQDRQARQAALLKSPAELGVDLVRDVAKALARRVAPDSPVRFNSGGEQWWGASRPFPLGPGRTLRMLVVVPEADLVANLHRVRWWILGITALAIALAVWRATVMARELSRPIAALASDSDRIASGDLSPATTITSGIEEVGRLARAHEQMRNALRTLLKLERDLEIAREIQQATIPDRVPELSGFALAAWSEPAEETGGDTYDLVALRGVGPGSVKVVEEDPERVLILLADATGHGIGPALSSTEVRSMLRMAARLDTPLAALVEHLNEQLHDDLSQGRFVTVWVGEISAGTGTLTGFSAGQGPLLHYVAALDEVRSLHADAPPLGVLTRLDVVLPAPVELAPGDVFAVVSDGIFDSRDARDEMFGTERVSRLLREHAGQGPEVVLDRLRTALSRFTGERPAADDRTVILIQKT